LALVGGIEIGHEGTLEEGLMDAAANTWLEGLEKVNVQAAGLGITLRGFWVLDGAAQKGNAAVIRCLMGLDNVLIDKYDLSAALCSAVTHNQTAAMTVLEELGAVYDGDCLRVVMLSGREDTTRLVANKIASRKDSTGPYVLLTACRQLSNSRVSEKIYQIIDDVRKASGRVRLIYEE
jgi:hypothetical protein